MEILDQKFGRAEKFTRTTISQQPLELQNIAAPKFGVAFGAQFTDQVYIDLGSP